MALRLTGLNSGIETESMIKKLMDAERTKLNKVESKKSKLEWKQEKWKELNTKLYDLYTNKVSGLRFSNSYTTKTIKSTNEAVARVEADPSAVDGVHSLSVKQIATTSSLISDKVSSDIKKDSILTDIGFNLGEEIVFKTGEWANKEITEDNEEEAMASGKVHVLELNGDTTVADLLDMAKKAGLNANFDEKQSRFYISAKESGADANFSIEEFENSTKLTSGLYALGLEEKYEPSQVDDIKKVNKVVGQNAIFKLDGTEYETHSNTNSINGINLTLAGTTPNYNTAQEMSISLNVATNVDEVYNNFKSFVKEYNSILKEMNSLFYADSAKGYHVLTREEKDKLSEKEVEDWEKKVKDSLLRKDEKLGNAINIMRSSLMKTVKVGADEDGKGGTSYSLSSFGIMTSTDYKEKGLLHIFGDKEDGVYSAREDKFKKALMENGQDAADALQQIMTNLYNGMTEAMKGTKLSSAMTFYNDKEMTTLATTYKKEYNDLETKLNKIEDKYYKQFAAMEKAMATLNNQTNYMANMFGMR